MKKLLWGGLLAVILLVVVGPVLLAQLSKSQPRQLQGVRLNTMAFEEVTFTNPAAELRLAGLLFRPDGEGPFPVAVIIHGSGTSNRNNGWYLALVQYLRDNGIAVLLPDKRGSGEAEGNWRTASFLDLASDTSAATAFLKSKSDLPVSAIGVIGMSQGGHIAPLVAHRSSEVAFVVNVVGSSLPMHDTLLYEENNNLREMGFLPGISDGLARLSTLYLRKVSQAGFWNVIGNFDPLPFWKSLEVPSLVLYGADDTNVPSARSAERLRALDKSNITVRVFKGSGHALESPVGTGDRVFREDALRTIADFILMASPAARQTQAAPTGG